MAEKSSNRLRVRGFISLLTALNFLIMTVSGIILFVTPEGRIVFWQDWRFLGITKSQWGDMHITTSLLFILAGVWHITLNWRALLNYFRNRTQKTFVLKSELLAAVVITLFFTFGAVFNSPPLSYILSLNEYIRASWIHGPEDEPVISHAELLPFSSFVKKVNIELAAALLELEKQGVKINGPDEKLLDIAKNNNSSPSAIYKLIESLQNKPDATSPEAAPVDPSAQAGNDVSHSQNLQNSPTAATDAANQWTPELVEERYEGKGAGHRKLAELCAENGLDPATIVKKLAARKVTATPEDTLKQIASANAQAPMELIKMILDGEKLKK